MSMKLRTQQLFLVIACCLGAFLTGCSHSVEVADVALDVEVADVALDMDRPSDTDILKPRNGDHLTGTFLNESINIQTPYGTVSLNNRKIASIDMEGGVDNLAAITTVNNNRFSGLLEVPVFVFKLQDGTTTKVRCEQVLKAVFQMTKQERKDIPQRQFMVLKNGDFFSGEVKNKNLLTATPYANIPVDLSSVDRVAFIGDKNVVTRITMMNGDVVKGVLEREDIEIGLDVGGEVRLYKDQLDMLYCRNGYVPEWFRSATALARHIQKYLVLDIGNGIEMSFVLIPAGQFMMGSSGGESDRDDDEGPRHWVQLTRPFYMLATEVTQLQYKQIVGANPSESKGIDNPVDTVSWDDAMEFCRLLSKETGRQITLPTEAQWEYACRAGSDTRFCFGNDKRLLGSYCWYDNNSSGRSHPAATKRPNAWGLYDMHGNVWEWCSDWYAEDSYPTSTVADPSGPLTGQYRVIRGGNQGGPPVICRCADRHWFAPDARHAFNGFRVVFMDL